MPGWFDTHCHLDAAEFDVDRDAVLARAAAAGVTQLLLPAVHAANFERVRELAHAHGFVYALGIHPLFVAGADDADLRTLEQALARHRDDARLVAVGEIGLDHFVPGHDRARQQHFYRAQLRLARDADLPVVLHVRRSADALLAGLRRMPVRGGIAHAFNGSEVQANAFVERGFALGFGGAMTFERALQIRRLAASLPEHALVLETDAPDIPPQWLYRTAAQRAAGATSRNEPGELPRIARTLAELRGWTLEHTRAVDRRQTRARRCRALASVTQRLFCLAPVLRARHAAAAAGQFSGCGVPGRAAVLRASAQPLLAAAVGAAGRGPGRAALRATAAPAARAPGRAVGRVRRMHRASAASTPRSATRGRTTWPHCASARRRWLRWRTTAPNPRARCASPQHWACRCSGCRRAARRTRAGRSSASSPPGAWSSPPPASSELSCRLRCTHPCRNAPTCRPR